MNNKLPIIYDGSWAEYGLKIKMKTSTKIKTFINYFFIAITVIITARHFIGYILKKI